MPHCPLLPNARLPRQGARLALSLALLAIVAGCGSSNNSRYAVRHHRQYSPTRYYPPPGPTSDPWGPYIREASGRFGLPEQWVRAVMRQESGGQEDVISWAGAMGLMQVMPDTYDEMRARYSLGDDPFDPHNNILAGTAYLREMYDRYGAPGFLAAYNAGPNRLDRFLTAGTPLPDETVSYVAAIGPRLGPGTPFSGPTAVYVRNYNTGGAATRLASARTPTPAGCDPDAAYDPSRPCAPLRPQVMEAALVRPAPMPTPSYCDPDAAYDPSRPCQPRTEPPADSQMRVASIAPTVREANIAPPQPYMPQPYVPQSLSEAPVRQEPLAPPRAEPYRAPEPYTAQPYRPAPPPMLAAREPQPRLRYSFGNGRPIQESMTQPAAFRSAAPIPEPPAQWAIQVGAYPTLPAAQAAAERARALAPELLHKAKTALPPTTPLGTRVAFRARLFGLTAGAASDACTRLSDQGLPCMTVPPSAS